MAGRLTPREREVVRAIQAGAHSYKAIANALTPSRRGEPVRPGTARQLVVSIARKIPRSTSPTLIRVILWACNTTHSPIDERGRLSQR